MSQHQPETPASYRRGTARWGSWFGFLGGAIAWVAHLTGSYLIAEFGCIAGLGEIHFTELSAVAWLVILLSVVTVAVAVAATVVSYRLKRQFGSESQENMEQGAHYLSRMGVVTSGLFTLIIVVQSVPIVYYLREC